MTEDLAHSPPACDGALVRVFDILGKRWNGVIIGVLSGGPASFSELRRAVHGISDSVLSDRLTELAATGLIHRTVAEGPPIAVRYELTKSGTNLMPALRELSRWAEDNLDATAPTA